MDVTVAASTGKVRIIGSSPEGVVVLSRRGRITPPLRPRHRARVTRRQTPLRGAVAARAPDPKVA